MGKGKGVPEADDRFQVDAYVLDDNAQDPREKLFRVESIEEGPLGIARIWLEYVTGIPRKSANGVTTDWLYRRKWISPDELGNEYTLVMTAPADKAVMVEAA